MWNIWTNYPVSTILSALAGMIFGFWLARDTSKARRRLNHEYLNYGLAGLFLGGLLWPIIHFLLAISILGIVFTSTAVLGMFGYIGLTAGRSYYQLPFRRPRQ